MSERIEAVLGFWFAGVPDGLHCGAERMEFWFAGAPETDREIGARFGGDLEAAIRGDYDAWEETPRGRLALIVLLDQFSRNVLRDTPREIAQDSKAQGLTLRGLERQVDRALAPAERVFFYLPLEHAEDLSLQQRSVACFAGLAAAVPPEVLDEYQGFLRFAEAHRRIIERFGRFPYQNAIAGRQSTPEELEFLEQRGAPFFL